MSFLSERNTGPMDSKSIVNHKLTERIKAHKYNVRDKRGNCSLYEGIKRTIDHVFEGIDVSDDRIETVDSVRKITPI